jgi:hypothetical protein
MLLGGFVLQGTILASTAIEKYLKAALVARNITFRNTHDVRALYDSLKASGAVVSLNESFLKVLGKAYKLRYPDDLPISFNIALAQIKILVELDTSVHAIRTKFVLQKNDGSAVRMKLDVMLDNNDVGLLDRNIAFGTMSRTEILSFPSQCLELRVLDNATILEAKYQAASIPDDGIFDSEGLKPNPA